MLQRSIAKGTRKHLSILASDKFEGRETGKQGAEITAAFLAREFKKLKLAPLVNGSYLQDVPLIETSTIVNSLEVNNTKLRSGKDFTFSGSGETRTIQADEVTFIGFGTEPDLKNTDIVRPLQFCQK